MNSPKFPYPSFIHNLYWKDSNPTFLCSNVWVVNNNMFLEVDYSREMVFRNFVKAISIQFKLLTGVELLVGKVKGLDGLCKYQLSFHSQVTSYYEGKLSLKKCKATLAKLWINEVWKLNE